MLPSFPLLPNFWTCGSLVGQVIWLCRLDPAFGQNNYLCFHILMQSSICFSPPVSSYIWADICGLLVFSGVLQSNLHGHAFNPGKRTVAS